MNLKILNKKHETCHAKLEICVCCDIFYSLYIHLYIYINCILIIMRIK